MAVREFIDAAGVTWRVWNTRPSKAGVYRDRFSAGWLTFESRTERRRLAPIPPNWEDASDERLGLMSRVAEVVERRRSSGDSWRNEDTPPHGP